MGITNNIPPSRLIQPGVIDNAAARPASPFEGQCIFQKDTDQLLVWNGTAWVVPNSPAQNPMGLELVASGTVTSGSSYLEILNCFSATYDNYRIVMSGFQSSGNQGMSYYLGTNAATGVYYGSMYYDQYTGAVVATARQNGANYAYVGISESAVPNGSYTFDVTNPFLSTYSNTHGTYNGRNFSGWHGSLVNNTTSYTGIRLFSDAGNTLVAGKVRVYGYRQV